MAKPRKCPNPDCGKLTRTTGPYCPWCQTELEPIAPVAAPAEPDQEEVAQSERRKLSGFPKFFVYGLGLILLGIILAVAIWGCIQLFGGNNHQAVIVAPVASASATPSPEASVASATPAPTETATASSIPASQEASVENSAAVTAVGTIMVNGKNTALDQGNRLYWSSGREITGEDPGPDGYSKDQMAKIAKTWHDVEVNTETGDVAVLFCYSCKINGKLYSPGALLIIAEGKQSVKLSVLNGEIVIWHNTDDMKADIQERISTEIANGNLSIRNPLAFKYASADFESLIPADLLKARKVILVAR